MAHLLYKNLICCLNIRVPFALMAAGIEGLVLGFASQPHMPGKRGLPSLRGHLLPFQRHIEVPASN